MATIEALSRVDDFLLSIEQAQEVKGRRLTWDERVEQIYEFFPRAKDPDWNHVLSDLDTLGEVLRDILRLEQAEPGKSGPRPAPELRQGMKTLRKWKGDDHSIERFPEAFACLAYGYSLTHLSRKVGISRSQVNRLLKGECDPTPHEMNLVARAFGKEPSYFLEFRSAMILAALGARLELVPEATIGLFRKVVKA